METSKKPKIESKKATIPCKRYGELIASEKRAIPKLQKQLNEANRKKKNSHITMLSKRRKFKWGVWHEQYT